MSMIVTEQKKGQKFINKGDRLTEVNIILKGSVTLKTDWDEMVLESGSVIGLLEASTGSYVSDYIAREDSLIVTYSYQGIDDFKEIFAEQPQYVYAFLHAALVQCQRFCEKYTKLYNETREMYLLQMKLYREYQMFCKQNGIEPINFEKANDIKAIELGNVIKKWEIDYVEGLIAQPVELMKKFYVVNDMLSIGEIFSVSAIMNTAIAAMAEMNEYIKAHRGILVEEKEGEADILSLWFDATKKLAAKGEDIENVQKIVRDFQKIALEKGIISGTYVFKRFQEYFNFDYEKHKEEKNGKKKKRELPDEVNMDYFEYIINYADFEAERQEEIFALIAEYRECVKNDKKGTESVAVYKRVTELFYETYTKAFFRSIDDGGQPPAIMMLFFNFGFMDPELVSEENVNDLMALNEKIASVESENVFTFYDWLKKIFQAERDTSKNEFDLDYAGSLRELRKANRITPEEEKFYQMDRERMVRYELDNMFHSGNRGTFGRTNLFSPILCDDNITKTVEEMYVSVDKLMSAIDRITKFDFGCFYREVLFYDSDHEGGRFMVQKEVMPDIIMMPNIGKQAMMWQENVGADRDTPARFIFPILSVDDIDSMMLETVARYRWEICRKIQGMRWNDISEHSLTSEYYDYITYYKKNKELSATVKEKLKNVLTRVKGSYREVFVIDYVNWIKYESGGSFRLNKVARDILSRYCPFPQETRNKLIANPMFKTVFSKYENVMMKREEKVRNTLSRYKANGGEITQIMLETLHFVRK